LNIVVSNTLDVTVSDFFVPDLKGLGADAVEDRQEATLKCILEHACLNVALFAAL